MVDFKFKILLIGSAAVGKTSIVHRFVDNEFKNNYAATIGVKFLTKDVKISIDGTVALSLWDIAGQGRFEDLRTTFYRGSSGALLVFDLTRSNTFQEIEAWHAEVVKHIGKEIPFILIGNKLDLKGRKVKINEARKFAKSKNGIYIETSAKTGQNVEKSFLELTEILVAEQKGIPLVKQPFKTAEKPKKPKLGDVSSYLVKSKVHEYIKSKGCNVSRAILDGHTLNNIITRILDKAIIRAQTNGRKTVQPKDI